MDVDDDGSVVEVGKSLSVPGFLRKVFTQELGDDGGRDHKLLVIVVHVVLLESSFFGFDPVSNIEFQSLGKFFNIYESLANGFGMHWVHLDEHSLVPFLSTTPKQQITDFEAKVGSILDFNTHNEKTLDLNTQKEKSLNLDSQIRKNQEYMDVDDDSSVVEELGDDSGCDHKLLVIVVHAILLESSFVGFDPVSNIEVHGFQFPNEWPSSAFRMSLSVNGSVNEIDTVVLKFQSLGKFFNFYGSLANGSETHWVRLDEHRLVMCEWIRRRKEMASLVHKPTGQQSNFYVFDAIEGDS
ncbi:unnamed protein product [Ilex paraguariensis]|uniref:Uncharacterized protein n=1 Tax=Ilex paraguariensis TaxID=185542 RepID=A0ABC8UMA1_9AQUA